MVCKITPRWKKLNLMLNKWYCQVVFWTSPPMSFALVVSLRWYFVPSWVSLGSQQSVDTLFPKYQVKFLDYDRLVFICFYQLFQVSSEPLLKKPFEKFFCVIIPDQRGHHMLTIFGVVKLVDVKKYCVDIFLYSRHHEE